MAIDNDEIVVGANGHIYVGEIGATEPTTVTAAWAAAWTELGYATEDGVTLTDSKTMTSKMAWQSFYPVRRLMTGRDFTAAFTLLQWNLATVPLAFGGGAISNPGAGVWRYNPPAPEDVDERALGVEWIDGAKTYRLIIPRGIVVENVQTKIARNDSADLPLTFGIIGEDGVKPWYILSNDPSLGLS